ncbi:DNA mismatch repair endonuclease MutL [Oscillospiraceae bacterium LTW-04]|nr:DNA mismatch repair endonuclease MutL [Oscillospiraceae bacterium MB24-C1]
MGKINVLPATVAELIAAGEVVDRPASIIKELVENALDAGATRISVELKNGGITYLRVTDNGSGMTREDVPLAFIRHATSKISSERDLDSIGTLGFRGEALPSIAAVSHVKVITRTADNPIGCCYSITANESPVLEEIGCAVGTSIEVRDVFYNTPARMKFLKKDATEGNAVASLMDRLALANPAVALELIRDGKRVLKTPGDGKLLSVLRVVCGAEVAAGMIPVSLKSEGVLITGLISRPNVSRSTRSLQTFFINSRYVRSKTCAGAVEEAYKNRLMAGRFPACVLNLEVDFDTVDVNVHPAKLEVRFSNERLVYNAVYSACIDALSQHEHGPADFKKKKITPFSLSDFDYTGRQVSLHQISRAADSLVPAFTPRADSVAPKTKVISGVYTPPVAHVSEATNILELHDDTQLDSLSLKRKVEYPPVSASVKNTLIDIEKTEPEKMNITVNTVVPPIPQQYTATRDNNDISPKAVPTTAKVLADQSPQPETDYCPEPETDLAAQPQPYRIIGELFDTYILVEQAGQFIMIDKHAAHERYIYNGIKHLEESTDRQIFLTPQAITLPRDEYFALTEHPEALKTLGIVAEDFGEGTLLVREIPMLLDGFSVSGLLGEVAKALLIKKNSVTPQMLDELLYSVSCRAAVMAGKRSSLPEMSLIADMVLGKEQIRHCPHGRPVLVTYTQREVEKLFGRIG